MYRFFNIVIVMLLAGIFQVSAVSASQTQEELVNQVVDQMHMVTTQTTTALDLFWVPIFAEVGLQEPMVLIMTLRPDEVFFSQCGIAVTGLTDNAFYCPKDSWNMNGVQYFGVLVLPLLPLAEMSAGDMWGRGTIPAGSYASVAMISHEFSHHIVDEFALQMGIPLPTNPNSELIADCLAGRFMGLLDEYQNLTAEQIDAILIGWGLIGDSSPDINSHGTPAERNEALSIGYYGGNDAELKCFQTYWPEAVN